MWQKDRSADAAGRLENLKELIRSMEEFENLQGFLEHIALVMDNEKAAEADAVNIMTLHAAKGLEFDTVFLPGWEEGVFPNQRALDDQGRAGLEEERRLGHVGLTRARKRAKIYFATNRRMHGLWQTNIPVTLSRRIAGSQCRGHRGAGRLRRLCRLWRLALRRHDLVRLQLFIAWLEARAGQARPQRLFRRCGLPLRGRPRRRRQRGPSHLSPAGRGRSSEARSGEGARRSGSSASARRLPLTIEGELVAKSTGTVSAFTMGDRVFHQKFGNGNVTAIDGNKLTIQFDRAGEKRVVDSFVERV